MRSHFSAAVRRESGARQLPSSRNLFARASLHSRWALVWLGILFLAGVSAAQAKDDNENSTPTAWWFYTGQSVAEIGATLTAKNARIVDIAPDNPGASTFTVTYVQNAGPYAKRWWWYVGVDASTLAKNLSVNQAQLISLKAYDIGRGNIRFAVAMISNSGADAKAWWYYAGQSAAQIGDLAKSNNARLIAVQSYISNGQTLYSSIMIANTGADAKAWWWYVNLSPQAVGNAINSNNARLLEATPAGNGNYNVAMESCSGGCPAWWWYAGVDMNGVQAEARNNGARAFTVEPYQGCNGASRCFVTVMISNTPADITACDASGCISEAKLSANICDKLANNVVGYSCLVGGMRPVYGGQARTSADPPALPMTPDLVTDIASVSKPMTAVAVLQLLAKDGLPITTKISSYIYSDWTQGANIDQLTFKELLNHSSGFGQLSGNACGAGITYSALKTLVAGGVTAANIGQPSYGNCNFALLRELMPALQGKSLSGYADGAARAQQSSSMYIDYVNANVFQPAGIGLSACKPPSGTNDILSYANPAGTTSGDDWGDWSLQCGSGGWVLSANQIFDVVNSLATSNTLLTAADKKQMFGDCLGWDCSVRSDCPDPNVCKNGDLINGAISVWTYAGVLKCNVPVVVVVNSQLPSPYQGGEDIIGLVKDAYNSSTVPGTGSACP